MTLSGAVREAVANPAETAGPMGPPRENYRPQIDGLRGLAVLGVLVSHFLVHDILYGHLGVRLFFVISGFLITERLLSARDALVAGQSSLKDALKRFFLRRALRIFPAYYLLLLVLIGVGAPDMRATAGWHLFHLTNIRFALIGDWQPWIVAHFWSLSIEEQFYALWPFLILLLPLRRLGLVVGGVLAASVLFRFVILLWPVDPAQATIWVVPPASFDALAAGGLLALARSQLPLLRIAEWLGLIAAVLWAASVLAMRYGMIPAVPLHYYAGWDTLNMVAFAGLVALAHRQTGGTVGAVLSLPPLIGLGRISYGVYLFHLPVLALIQTYYPELDYGPERFVIAGLATLAVAGASWQLVERPCLRLKERLAR